MTTKHDRMSGPTCVAGGSNGSPGQNPPGNGGGQSKIEQGSDLCGLPIVVPEHSAEAFATAHFSVGFAYPVPRFDQAVTQALVAALAVIMGHVRADSSPERTLGEEDHPLEALALNRKHESLGVRVQIRGSDWQAHDVRSGAGENVTKLLRVLPVAIQDQVALLEEESVESIGQIVSHLEHEVAVRIRCDAGDVDASSRELQEEQDVIGDEAPGPGHHDREEVGSSQRFPVCLQECAPRSPLAPLVGGLDSVLTEKVRNRSPRDFVADLGESALDPRVTPSGILPCDPEDPVRDRRLNPGASGLLPSRAPVPLSGDEPPILGQEGVRCHDRGHRFQHAPAESLSLHGQPTPFAVGEAKTPPAELSLQDTVLLNQVVDDLLLMVVDPASDGEDEELPRVKCAHSGRW